MKNPASAGFFLSGNTVSCFGQMIPGAAKIGMPRLARRVELRYHCSCDWHRGWLPLLIGFW
jgi:hypothetical protein